MTASAPPRIRLRPQSKYLSIAGMALQRVLIFRRTLFTNLAANLVWVAVFYFLWQAVFSANAQIGSFDWDRMRTYLILAYAGNMMLNGSNSVYRTIASIRFGDIALEIMRPYNFMLAQLSQSIGGLVVEGVVTAAVVLAISALLLHILPPATPLAALFFLVSMFLGFLTRFLIIYIVSLLCFWTVNWMGLHWTHTAITNIFSGALVPLEFFPPWLRAVALVLPFQAVINTPLLIYLGEIQGPAVWPALGVQVLWIFILWAIGTLMWRPCLRALEIMGG
jgi:ABC-2 type transport system permease protein